MPCHYRQQQQCQVYRVEHIVKFEQIGDVQPPVQRSCSWVRIVRTQPESSTQNTGSTADRQIGSPVHEAIM